MTPRYRDINTVSDAKAAIIQVIGSLPANARKYPESVIKSNDANAIIRLAKQLLLSKYN